MTDDIANKSIDAFLLKKIIKPTGKIEKVELEKNEDNDGFHLSITFNL